MKMKIDICLLHTPTDEYTLFIGGVHDFIIHTLAERERERGGVRERGDGMGGRGVEGDVSRGKACC